MVQGWIWKRAAALLAAAGLFAFLVGGISADDGNTEAVAARALKPTQAIAEVPEEFNELFQIQWGGGSLYHLKARLATMGCMVNTIWLYDNNKWNVYNQYNISQDNPIIQQFLQQYEEFIPATSLWANCYNVCEFGGGQCLTFDEMREQEGNFKEYFAQDLLLQFINFEIEDTLPCTREFHPTIQEHILPLLPIRPDACVVWKNEINTSTSITDGTSGYAWYDSVNAPPFFVLYDTSSLRYRDTREYKDVTLSTEIHELCHINQNWQQVQGLTTEQEQGFDPNIHIWFKNTPQGKVFIEMTGFIDSGYWQWDLPQNNIYRDIYSSNPIELSAELCSMYLLDKIGATQRYKYYKWVATERAYNGHFVPRDRPKRSFNTDKYLTPEIREWLETYMILPDISE